MTFPFYQRSSQDLCLRLWSNRAAGKNDGKFDLEALLAENGRPRVSSIPCRVVHQISRSAQNNQISKQKQKQKQRVRKKYLPSGGQFHQHSTSSFYARSDPKSAKKTVKLSSFFALLGSARIKAASKHVGEIDPWWTNCVWMFRHSVSSLEEPWIIH